MSVAEIAIIGGGQAGLATAHLAVTRGLTPVLLDAGDGPGGSWPRYYDSLTLFSPAAYSALPGMPFPGDPARYPVRDEVVEYLTAYARRLDAELRCKQQVNQVTAYGGGFVVSTVDGPTVTAPMLIAASGGFGAPYRPPLPGLDSFDATVLHAAQYRSPDAFAGARIVVVGAGNSAVQIAVELADVGRVSLATRRPIRWQPQRILGRDLHWWLARSGLDTAAWAPRVAKGTAPVIDDGRYRSAIRAGRPDRRPMFSRLDGDRVVWTDGTSERIDVLLLATGYRPSLDYLRGSSAVDQYGMPMHEAGVSTSVPGLGYVGLERQRSLSSATLRGVGRDAGHVLDTLLRQAGRPPHATLRPHS